MLETSSGRGKRILFIDDDRALLRLVRLSLERAGYELTCSPDGRDGLRQARLQHPDLILLDYMMPGLSGKEVFLELMQSDDPQLRNTPVVMLTGRRADESEQRELLEKGLAAYLHKPFGCRELLNIVDNVLVLSRIKERNRVLELALRQSFVSTVRSLVTLIFAKDTYTGQHSKKTAYLSESLALRCGLSTEEALNVKLGALLHDVGKIGVPETVLRKPTTLTAEEMEVMRLHVQYGDQALAGVPHMEAVRAMVMCHHEYWDGSGYPAGLSGEAIPLSARIIAVADAYDAMTSDRPYRRRLEPAEAAERLREAAGTQFDPAVVEKFFEYLAVAEFGDADETPGLEFLEELFVLV